MYKKARLFQRGKENLAYNFADKNVREKVGDAIYKIAEDEKKDESPFDEDYKTKLHKWGLKQFEPKFTETGNDDPTLWSQIGEDELKEMGMKAGHLRKWKARVAKWQKRLDLKAERENKDKGNDDDAEDAKEDAKEDEADEDYDDDEYEYEYDDYDDDYDDYSDDYDDYSSDEYVSDEDGDDYDEEQDDGDEDGDDYDEEQGDGDDYDDEQGGGDDYGDEDGYGDDDRYDDEYD